MVMQNDKKIAISLFDHSGIMLEPWRDSGYQCVSFDIQHKGQSLIDGIWRIHADLEKPLGLHHYDLFTSLDYSQIKFVSAFHPCDHLAVSGARWFKGKGLRLLAKSIECFATAAEFCESTNAPYIIENPVSTIATYWRKPDYYFSPFEYAMLCSNDNYTKETCLWVGNGFKMPTKCPDLDLGKPDDRIHKMSGKDRKEKRSQTPRGFALAVFEANHE